MKRLVVMLVMLCVAVTASAQDIIVKRSGETVKAKISYVGPDTVIYKLYDEQNGAEYEILKSDLSVYTKLDSSGFSVLIFIVGSCLSLFSLSSTHFFVIVI